MKYYSYEINYNTKNGSMGAVEVEKKMSKKNLLKHLQEINEVEEFKPRDFDCYEITPKEYKEM